MLLNEQLESARAFVFGDISTRMRFVGLLFAPDLDPLTVSYLGQHLDGEAITILKEVLEAGWGEALSYVPSPMVERLLRSAGEKRFTEMLIAGWGGREACLDYVEWNKDTNNPEDDQFKAIVLSDDADPLAGPLLRCLGRSFAETVLKPHLIAYGLYSPAKPRTVDIEVERKRISFMCNPRNGGCYAFLQWWPGEKARIGRGAVRDVLEGQDDAQTLVARLREVDRIVWGALSATLRWEAKKRRRDTTITNYAAMAVLCDYTRGQLRPDLSLSLARSEGRRDLEAKPQYNHVHSWNRSSLPAQVSSEDVEVEKSLSDAAQNALEASFAKTMGQGYVLSPERRKAIELHAMQAAQSYLEGLGYCWRDTSASKPYDLFAWKAGDESGGIYAEVKGTTTSGEQVNLTRNEVEWARAHHHQMVLFILHDIEVQEVGGEPVASGGVQRVLWPWDVDAGELQVVSYTYRLPGDGR